MKFFIKKNHLAVGLVLVIILLSGKINFTQAILFETNFPVTPCSQLLYLILQTYGDLANVSGDNTVAELTSIIEQTVGRIFHATWLIKQQSTGDITMNGDDFAYLYQLANHLEDIFLKLPNMHDGYLQERQASACCLVKSLCKHLSFLTLKLPTDIDAKSATP